MFWLEDKKIIFSYALLPGGLVIKTKSAVFLYCRISLFLKDPDNLARVYTWIKINKIQVPSDCDFFSVERL